MIHRSEVLTEDIAGEPVHEIYVIQVSLIYMYLKQVSIWSLETVTAFWWYVLSMGVKYRSDKMGNPKHSS